MFLLPPKTQKLKCNLLCLYFSISLNICDITIFWLNVAVKLLQVLCGWRRWVTGQQKAARDAPAARDEPLMEDVKSCLTYAAHMKDLTAGPAEDTQKQVGPSGNSQVKGLIVKNTAFILIRCPGHEHNTPVFQYYVFRDTVHICAITHRSHSSFRRD